MVWCLSSGTGLLMMGRLKWDVRRGMGFDRGRRGERGGRDRGKRGDFGEGGFDNFGGAPAFDGGARPRFRMPPQVVGEAKGVVKFYNAHKGFGFIEREDGGTDVFVHVSAVEQAGLTALANGQPLSFTLVDRGGKVSATDLKIEGEPMAVESRPRAPQRQLTGERASGTVKFFNRSKGFGFVQRDDGQADVFVHVSAVERAGMDGLNEGDRIEFDIESDSRGKYSAVNLVPGSPQAA